MATIQDPNTPANMQGVDGTHKAARVSLRPLDHSTGGHYSYGGFTGILPAALAANSEIFQFRWVSSAFLCAIKRITLSASVSTTFFAAGVPVQIDMLKAAGWSSAGTGGTAPNPAALLKRRASMANSVLGNGDMRISTTAALGVGTKTLESVAISSILAPGPITASLNGQIIPPGTVFFDADIPSGGHPLVLAANEGIVIRSVAVPATGTWTASVNIEWAEVPTY
jgi:hypothetical protein